MPEPQLPHRRITLPIPRWRSFRLRVMVVVVLVAVAPLAVVAFSHWSDGDLRDQLLKLAVFMLPLSVTLAWWLGWRMIRPLDALRRQAMQMTPTARAPGLNLNRADEFGDLASSFNTLLRALDERRAANETFVADLAHEFKNPVAAIRAAAESLSQGSPDERQARLSRVLSDSSQRLDALVTQFLELARAEAGMTREARTEVDLAQLVRGIAQSLRGMEQYKDVTLSVDGQYSVCVDGVTGRLESALRNLMDNAASFSGPGGWVRIHLDVVDGLAHVRVSDSGPGISEADLPRVFERFYTTRGERRGTGLGLALVRAVVEAHHGSITVTSPPGHGAVFEITLAAT